MNDTKLELLVKKKIREYLNARKRAENKGMPIEICEEFDRYFFLGGDGLLFHGVARRFGFGLLEEFPELWSDHEFLERRKKFLRRLLETPLQSDYNIISLATAPIAMFKYASGGNPFLVLDRKMVEKIHSKNLKISTKYEIMLLHEPLNPECVKAINMTKRDFMLVKQMYGYEFYNKTYCHTSKLLSELIVPFPSLGYPWNAIKPYLIKGIKIAHQNLKL